MRYWLLLIKREMFISYKRAGLLELAALFIQLFLLSPAIISTISIETSLYTLTLSYLVAAIIGANFLFSEDYHDSSLSQLLISGFSPIFVVSAKIFVYWLQIFCIGLIGLGLFSVINKVTMNILWLILIVLFMNSLYIAAINSFVASITLGIKKAGVLTFIISLPLTMMFLAYSNSVLVTAIKDFHYEIFITNLQIMSGILMIICSIALFSCSYTISKIQ